jgi:transglutaminase-like putative cysteine protease
LPDADSELLHDGDAGKPISSTGSRILSATTWAAWFPEKTDLLEVEVDLVAEMIIINPFDFFLTPEAKTFPFTYDRKLKADLAPYLEGGPGKNWPPT